MSLLAVLGPAGCATRDKYDQPPTVRITSPAVATTYTKTTVRISAAIDPVLDLPIALLENGLPFATLMPPSYALDWATSGVAEGAHTFIAEVALSSGPVRSQPVTIVVDRTPPAIVARTPAPGATNVMLRAPIQVAFSEPVMLSQPPDATFSLSISAGAPNAGAPVAVHPSLDAQGRTATIAIDDLAALSLPTRLTGAVGSTIADLAGNLLIAPSGDWSWAVPDFVKLPTTPLCPSLPPSSKLPLFAVGSDLRPVVAWASPVVRADGIHCQLQVTRYEGDAWTQTTPPSSNADSAASGATLALTPADQPIVAWRPPEAPLPGEIAVAAWTGGAWQAYPPIVPARGMSLPSIHPLLRVGRDGRPVLLWGTGASADAHFMVRWTGSAWALPFGTVPISSQQPFTGTHFDMILGVGGDPIVGWITPAGRGHVATWDGAAWAHAPDVFDITEAFLALDTTGAPMIVSGGSGSFFVQHHAGVDTWQPQPAIAVPPQARHPRIAAGPDGLPVVAWFDGQTKSIGMGRWLGQRWDSRAPFFSPSNAADEAPQLIVDCHGTAWIGWRDTVGQFNVWMPNF